MLPMATRVLGLSGRAGDQLFPLRNHFWLIATEKAFCIVFFILYGNTPESCPKQLEGLQRGEKGHLRRDEGRGMRSRGEFPFGQAGSGRLASSGGCPCVSPGRPPWDVGGGNAASQ